MTHLSKVKLPIFVLVLLAISLISPVFASTYIGYSSSNQGASTCGVNCFGLTANTRGIGEALKNPFGGDSQIVSVGVFLGNAVPNTLVILTFTGTPATTGGGCSGGATCQSVNAGQSFTLANTFSLTGLTTNAFNTINLPTPVTITGANPWAGVVFMQNPTSGNILMLCGTACGNLGGSSINGVASDLAINFGVTSPGAGSYLSTLSDIGNGIVGASFQSVAPAGGTITQCYGNCGSPPITLVNTNSTHSFNFNSSITVFYQFQSNLNGFIQNITTSTAKTNNANGVITLSVYEIPGCPAGQTPFSPQCPGQLQRSSNFGGAFPKGKISVVFSNLPVANGQWVGVALSSTLSGLDINDTNTNVSLFRSNGNTPVVLSNTVKDACTCAMGLWAWINGNTITGAPPSGGGVSCQNGIGDFLICLTQSFCVNQANTGCQIAGGIFWAMTYSGIMIVGLFYADAKTAGEEGIRKIPGEFYFWIPIGVFSLFSVLGALPVWFLILEFLIATYLFSSMLIGHMKRRE